MEKNTIIKGSRNSSHKSRKPTLLSLEKQVRGLSQQMKAEKNTNAVDTGNTGAAVGVSNSGVTVSLEAVPTISYATSVVDSTGLRTGDTILIDRVSLKYEWFIEDTTLATGDQTNMVRMVVFIDKSPNGAKPSYGAVFQDSVYTGGSSDYFSFVNFDARKRFHILHDEIYMLSYAGPTGAVGFFTHKFTKPLISVFATETAATTNAGNNQLYLAYVSDSGAAPNPQLVYSARIEYHNSS
jgi:hypothetical protein